MADNAPKVLLRSEATDGAVAVVELTGGGRPPLHYHNFDQAAGAPMSSRADRSIDSNQSRRLEIWLAARSCCRWG
jgi:hypothetical protein